MTTRVGDETWNMNDRQAAAILALEAEYPAPMVVGWRASGDHVVGSVFRTVEDDEEGRACGSFTVCTTGIVRWSVKP